jgi:hypothetical protein
MLNCAASPVDQILTEFNSELMKFTAHHHGNLKGLRLPLSNMPRTAEALAGHSFSPYFHRLDDALKAIAKDYGRWSDQVPFEVVGNLADELLAHGGILYQTLADGRAYVDIPFTAETMPV